MIKTGLERDRSIDAEFVKNSSVESFTHKLYRKIIAGRNEKGSIRQFTGIKRTGFSSPLFNLHYVTVFTIPPDIHLIFPFGFYLIGEKLPVLLENPE